jgi:hypothetical protein
MTTETPFSNSENQQPDLYPEPGRPDNIGKPTKPHDQGGCSFAVNHTVDASAMYRVVKPSAY